MSTQMKAQVDKLLSNVSSGYFPKGFVCEQILPQINVVQYSGKIGKYGKDHLRIVNTIVGGKGKAPVVETITRSSDSYDIESHALTGIVTERDYANVEQPFDAEKDETMGLTSTLLIAKEYSLASALTSTSVITQNTTLSGTAQFSDYTNSDPLGKFGAARLAIKGSAGVRPNKAIMSWEVFNKLRYHPGILEALGFKVNRPGQLSADELASAMELEKLHIADVAYNAAKEGQSDSMSAVWGKDILFYYAPDNATKMDQCLGYYVKLAGKQARQVTKTPLTNPMNSTEIYVADDYDFALTDVSCAYLIKNAIA